MDPKPIYITSDVHLGAVPAATERAFRQFLRSLAGNASGLLINGDLFDFWFEYRTVIPKEHYRVLGVLKDLVEDGLPIWFVGGNHDAWGGSFLRDEIGMRLLEGPAELTLGGRSVLVVHGDGVGGGDAPYQVLRRVIRNRLTVRAFGALHPDLGARIASQVSTTEEKVGTGAGANRERADLIHAWAADRLRERPDLEVVVAGHVHLPVLDEVLPGRFYANAGDWIYHSSYITLPPAGPPRMHRWPGEA